MELTCVICQLQSPKYKCSTCYAPYCSSGCWIIHKNGEDCKKPVVAENSNYIKKDIQNVTDDTIAQETLEKLGSNNNLKQLLKDPLLQKLLIGVDNSPDPYEAVQKAMQDSSFVEFVDLCLGTVEESADKRASNL